METVHHYRMGMEEMGGLFKQVDHGMEAIILSSFTTSISVFFRVGFTTIKCHNLFFEHYHISAILATIPQRDCEKKEIRGTTKGGSEHE